MSLCFPAFPLFTCAEFRCLVSLFDFWYLLMAGTCLLSWSFLLHRPCPPYAPPLRSALQLLKIASHLTGQPTSWIFPHPGNVWKNKTWQYPPHPGLGSFKLELSRVGVGQDRESSSLHSTRSLGSVEQAPSPALPSLLSSF